MGHIAVRVCPPADHKLWAKVRKDVNGCWEWLGATRNGYGKLTRFSDGKFRQFQVHRVTYEAARGPIAPGLVLDHLCRNVCCVRPDHLEPVTQAENIRRGRSLQAANALKTHCPQGHDYTHANTYVIPSTGGRMCRTCKRAGRAIAKQRHKARQINGEGPGVPGRPKQAT